MNAKLTELHIRRLEMDAKRKMIERARDNIAERGDPAGDPREDDRSKSCVTSYVQLNKDYADLSSRYGPSTRR